MRPYGTTKPAGLNNQSPSLAVVQDSHLQRVTIPEAAYVQFASLTWWWVDCAQNMYRHLILCNLCEWTRNLCIKLVIIKKLYYDARPTKYQDLYRVYSRIFTSHASFEKFVDSCTSETSNVELPEWQHGQSCRSVGKDDLRLARRLARTLS